jgi:hypothetical protein
MAKATPVDAVVPGANEKHFPVSWDEFHRDARALAWRLSAAGPPLKAGSAGPPSSTLEAVAAAVLRMVPEAPAVLATTLRTVRQARRVQPPVVARAVRPRTPEAMAEPMQRLVLQELTARTPGELAEPRGTPFGRIVPAAR